ncbi:MAG: non-homologous end-joining DNA ligase [bacterium]
MSTATRPTRATTTRQPFWLAPMLATLTAQTPPDSGWSFEKKYDGYRALAFCAPQGVRLLSRNQLSLADDFPEVVEALRTLAPPRCILDGEIIATRGRTSSFGALQQRLMERKGDSKLRITYVLFDILHFAGHDTTALPLEERRALLEQALEWGAPLTFSRTLSGRGTTLLAAACRKGWEGLIGKRAGSTYQHRRSTDWLKFKCDKRQEFVIGGYTAPQGSRHGFGALLLGYYNATGQLCYAGKVGTGFDAALLTSLGRTLESLKQRDTPFDCGSALPREATWVKPKLVGEVRFTEWTGDGHLRHPAFLGMRPDKSPRSVIRELPSP